MRLSTCLKGQVYETFDCFFNDSNLFGTLIQCACMCYKHYSGIHNAESHFAVPLTPQNKAQRCQWFMGKGLKDIFLKHILTTYMVSATTRSQTYCNVRPLWVNHQDLYLHFYTVSISYNLYMKTTIIKIFIYIFTWLVFLTFYIWRRQSSRALYTCLHG